MKQININNATDSQVWKISSTLKKKGFKKISDCYWTIIFENDKYEIYINR